MGMLGARFGRNVPLELTYPEPMPQLLEPNPRVVSRELLTRDEFKPATIVNVLAAAWLQFEVHDWFSHGKNDAGGAVRARARRGRRRGPSGRCGSSARAATPAPTDDGDAADVRHRRHALVGRLADLRQRRGLRARDPLGRGRQAAARPGRPAAARPRRQDRPDRRRRELLARPRAPAHALHARAQRDLRPAARGVPDLDGRPALRRRRG